MTFGKARFSENNALLNARFADRGVLIAAHRGSWVGNLIQNTTGAYRAALLMGADIVESDMSMTTDGVVYSFHDGSEPRVFGVDRNITTMASAEVDAMYPRNAIHHKSTHKVQRLEAVCEALTHGELVNIDRSWDWFDRTLAVLDRYPHMARQALIKAPLRARHALETLDRHPVKYMFMPICYTMADIEAALAFEGVNVVGAELIAKSEDSALYGEGPVRYLHERGLFAWVNAITLGDVDTLPLYAGLDDDVSVLEDPARGWGRLIDLGFDVLQTDWPALLRDYRAAKRP